LHSPKVLSRGDADTFPAIIYFDMVRRCGSVRQASRRLNVSASAVNRQLLYLESEIGAPLFERLPSGMKLTPAGEVLARHSIAVIQDAQRTASEFDNLRGVRRGKVTLITVEGVNSDFLPAVIGRMLDLHPLVEIEATTAGSTAIPPVVLSGDAAAARCRQISHPRRRSAGPSIDAGASCHVRGRHKAPLKTVVQATSIELMKSLALRGLGVAFQTPFGLEAEFRDGLLVHLPLNDPAPLVSELGAYVRAGRPLPSAVDAFLNVLGDELRAREAQEP
jgi:DNA-binding transcriptional LysR family regulator